MNMMMMTGKKEKGEKGKEKWDWLELPTETLVYELVHHKITQIF